MDAEHAPSPFEHVPAPDAGTAAEDDLSIADASARVLDGVDRALAALDAGTYGRCGTCGAPIDGQTLASDPLATSCGRCEPA